jgi:Zn-dependent M28 family amino/carboxypeptidase
MGEHVNRKFLVGMLVSVTALAQKQDGAPAARWWSYMQVLASDRFEGRGTGTPGHRKAVEYAAEQFKKAGLKPLGTDGYFQPIEFVSRTIDEARSKLELVRNGKVEKLDFERDAFIVPTPDLAESLEAPLVFAGYGLTLPESEIEDLKDLDVKGKIVLYFMGAPRSVQGPLSAHAQSVRERWKAFQAAGALGWVRILNPESMDLPWPRWANNRSQPAMTFADRSLLETSGLQFVATANPARAEKWFQGSGHTFAEILAAEKDGKPLPRFELPAKIRITAKQKSQKIVSDNVVALLPGSDSKLKDEYVVVSAHIDHLGIGKPIRGDSIYNGAMDNASGAATVLDVAASMAAAKDKPRRSIVFLLPTAEEMGLLVSKYYAQRPTVPANAIVANLNTDCFMPLHPLKSLLVFGLDESNLGDDVRAVGSQTGLEIMRDPQPKRNLFIRSDQYSFILQGVPALAVGVGFKPGTSEEKTLKKWLTERYHAPSDDLRQPMDRRTVEGFNRAFMTLAMRIANRETKPQWNESSFFRRFAKDQHAEPAKRWWSHMEVLASDSLEGRLTGTPGHRKAAEYAAEQLKQAGLKPAGTHGYFQPIDFVSRKIDEVNSKLELVRNDKAVQLDFADDGYLSPAPDLAATLEAPLVFIGYGLTIPENEIEDLKGIDLKGKVAVFLSGAPAPVLGPLSAHAQSARERWKSFKDAGALGWVRILDPNNMDIPWPRLSNSRNQPAMTFADASLNDINGLRLSVTVNPARAEKWFEGSGHTFAEIVATAKDNKPPPRFELPSKIRVVAKQQSQNVTSDNIVGLMPGSDPKLKNEYVVVTAHIDHLGVGNPINGDSIYNGAMDNAAGTAAVLDAAARLAESTNKPRRSLIFLLVTAEEKGLLGSKYFANRPTVPANAIVANINTDNPLPLYPLKSLIVLGLNESNLGDDVRAIGSEMGLEILVDPQPKRNTFIRSDQYSFIREGIPALAIKVGFKAGTAEEATQKKWLTERYHAPSDDLLQPINKQTAEDFDRAFAALVLRVANRDSRPSWYEQSFFRRFAKLRS